MPPRLLLCLCPLLAALPARAQAPAQGPPNLPRVVLVGDSIRMGYAPLVARRLQGLAVVVSPAANGGDSTNVLKHLDEWVIAQKPDVVHLNCGLHDLKRFKKTRTYQVELAAYEANLKEVVARLRRGSDAALVFANTTPTLDDRHAKRGANFDRFEADVRRYNAAAHAVMQAAGVPVHDLHGVVRDAGPEQVLAKDGTHYAAAGNERLADAVADCVRRQLTVRRAKPGKAPPSGEEAAAAYRKDEAARDALVPAAFKQLKFGEFRVPADAAAWKAQRPAVLRAVEQSLGDLPPRPSPARARLITRELRPGYV